MRPRIVLAPTLGIFLILGICVAGAAGMRHGTHTVQAEQVKETQANNTEAKPAEKVYGAPKDIKEAAAIAVFLGWLWLSILVLIYLLRLKIRECDRLDNFDYFLTSEKPDREA